MKKAISLLLALVLCLSLCACEQNSTSSDNQTAEALTEAIKEENKLEMELEKSIHKEISLIEFSDIKHSSYLMLNYCKYKTLDEIISVYLNLKKLNLHSKDYMNEVEK